MIEIFDLKVGDLFIYKGAVYEIIAKDKWTSKCKYLNDKYRFGRWCKYLYCDFSNYIKVEI